MMRRMQPTIRMTFERKSEAEVAANSTGLVTLREPREDEKRWRVNWPRVTEADRWYREQWLPIARTKIIAERQRGTLTMKAAVKQPSERTYAVLPSAVPEHARKIYAVLLSRCAGYVKPPRAEDVVSGLKRRTPNEVETDAIRVYLWEATDEEVREAWKAGEFTLEVLMQCVDRIAKHDEMTGLHSIREWLIVETAQCEQNA